ncbi:MAG: peptidoglycan DD-metalloendopeptidase family protein [Clostridiales bacterium]|nr:peptidoglycan DD-metalloendopeptidase family protein [Clostridiales bacterium]
MKSKTLLVRVICLLLAALMLASIVYVVVGESGSAGAVTQSEIDNLKKKKEQIERKKTEIRAQINSYEYEQKSLLARKQVLDTQMDLTEEEIANITEQIQLYTELIAQKEIEVQEAQKREDEQLRLFKERLRIMEEGGSISYLAVLFEASSFADLLARLDFIEQISKYDEYLYEQLKAAKHATIEAKESLEEAKAGQEEQKVLLEAKRAELERQVAEAGELIKAVEQNIAEAKALYEQESKAAQDIQEDINKKVAELKRQQEQSGKAVVGTGKLIWPTPSCYIVTSQFGRRFHPIYKEYRMHYGVDIGAKYGASVLAADDGTVITSSYDSSYGHYIVISHGNGMTTLYAHLSSRLVKAGDTVTQGKTIGKVGSTGSSTGPHLHFEVSVNGSRVNPLQYFTGYTIKE